MTTGNHGTAALVPQSEDAAHIAEAISAAYFCLESDYPTAGRGLPGIYDRPAYQFRYLGGGDEETLQTLERLGIYTPPATDSDD